jgi:hypothetical protein
VRKTSTGGQVDRCLLVQYRSWDRGCTSQSQPCLPASTDARRGCWAGASLSTGLREPTAEALPRQSVENVTSVEKVEVKARGDLPCRRHSPKAHQKEQYSDGYYRLPHGTCLPRENRPRTLGTQYLSKEIVMSLVRPSQNEQNRKMPHAVALRVRSRVSFSPRVVIRTPVASDLELPLDLASRHIAAANISAVTNAIGIVVSESAVVRVVRLFCHGKSVGEIIPELWMIDRTAQLRGPEKQETFGDLTIPTATPNSRRTRRSGGSERNLISAVRIRWPMSSERPLDAIEG